MINFTVGPVQSSDGVRAIGGENVPYFRTSEFSEIMLENERLIKKFAHTTDDSRVVFMTCSGTGGMETAIMNTLTKDDKALVVNGGSFGERFVELLKTHEIPFAEIKLEYGESLKSEHLTPYEGQGYTAFLLQKHETSTGVHYNINLVGEFCKRNHCFLIVDAISTFLTDPFDMAAIDAGIMITGSQKALACPPGVAILALAPSALDRIERTKCLCRYLDLKLALKNQERGQTPWTPAVGVLLQINQRLKEIDAKGGDKAEIERVSELALYFRNKLRDYDLPFEIISESLSNAVTPLHPTTQSAYEIFLKIKNEYGMWVCPNGGDMKDTVFRVGHLGNLHKEDYDRLVDAFVDLRKKSFI